MELTLEAINPALQTTKEMSKRYVWMDSRELVNNLLSLKSRGEEVFELRSIKGRKTKKGAGRGKHIIRVRMKQPFNIDGEVLFPEIVITNSYDGSSPLSVNLGIYRQICTNGLCVQTKDLGSFKIRHTGTTWDAVQDMLRGMAANLPKFSEAYRLLASTNMTDTQIHEFAKKAAKLRWDKVSEDATFEELVTPLRPEDEGSSLWKVFNVVQEKLVNGGVKLEGMRRTGRKLTNASEDLRINTELFELAMEYANSPEGQPLELVS